LSFNLIPTTSIDALKWPLPVHRLDKATSGLLIIAKTIKSRIELGRLFENKKILKTYHAIVMGEIRKSGKIDTDIENKTAITYFETLKTVNSLRSEKLNLVKFQPKTGRTHQLRIHSACIGKSILGDTIYGDKNNTLKHKGLFLCATGLSFQHPILKTEILVQIDYPKKYDKRLESEERRWLKFN
jgi:23S rRNA-/tRNA-specific pseudouridylate synthase